MPRFRLTVRRMIVAMTAILCCAGLGVAARWRAERFRLIAEEHGRAAEAAAGRVSAYHEGMAEKYRRAARYPWLPVAPDPPMPE